jgi:hypothetical protein
LRLSLIANGWTADAATVPALRPAGSNRQQRCQYRRGEYAPTANFNAGADGHGGSLITDPPASSSVAQTPLIAHH